MKRFLSPGFRVKPKEEPKEKPKVGRPTAKAAEGALDLGEKRVRTCRSQKDFDNAQRIRELERRLELVETVRSESTSSEEKVQQVLSLHEEAADQIKTLRMLLQRRRSKSGSFL